MVPAVPEGQNLRVPVIAALAAVSTLGIPVSFCHTGVMTNRAHDWTCSSAHTATLAWLADGAAEASAERARQEYARLWSAVNPHDTDEHTPIGLTETPSEQRI